MTVKRRSYRSPARHASAGQTRARIVAAACDLLADGGKQAWSLEAVAQRAGVTRLTVYNHFESKGGLMEAVFDDLAQKGGLSELADVFADTDPRQALRRVVSVFCGFWASHRSMLPKFRATVLMDDEIAQTLRQRSERRRQGLTVLVQRLMGDAGQRSADLVDVLFALTSFETFEALSVRNRRPKAIESLLHALVEQAVSCATAKA
ncbi:MAG TPA: TetR/AcrR family transcriptional regulator [Burkholderiaceae bacterium]